MCVRKEDIFITCEYGTEENVEKQNSIQVVTNLLSSSDRRATESR